MLQKIKNRKSELAASKSNGFTIIEVLIVLAIAGLILLIVFLAVPNLQRNSRNTQTRNSVSTILGYVSDYESNNSGAVPAGAYYDQTTGDVCMGAAAVSACASTSAPGYVGKLQGGLSVGFTFSTTAPSTSLDPSSASTLEVWIGGTCGSGNLLSNGNPSPRAAAVGFRTESGSTTTPQCTDS